MRKQWRNNTHRIMKASDNVCFLDLIEFLRDQVSLIKQPIFGAIYGLSSNAGDVSGNHKKLLSVATEENSDTNSKTRENCVCCKKGNHTIQYCLFFKRKTYQEKSEFVRESGLCFGCLRKGHMSKNCYKRLKCSVICMQRQSSYNHAQI